MKFEYKCINNFIKELALNNKEKTIDDKILEYWVNYVQGSL